ncbi:four helix bundle protein [Orenia metallireducens]|uniref:Four helix bundle protein n=1 Tax=Orenia metallireducens TaxID=1413210 RepID=A0A285IHX9_9FIRM|nr:four helix bundle protein [Orenia metallireducens]PRX17222.1 four helix bundle protein [Orenia metallireducens]SNY47585.1 four helix bundle protein [Orenia metallireducens]
MSRRESIVYQRAFEFSIRIVNLYKYLCDEKKEYVLSKQVLRSGTSIGANIREGLEGQSDRDFISKFSISLKEAVETEYWIDLLSATDYLNVKVKDSLLSELEEIIKILTSAIKTVKKRL